jgi:hypothetical protein
MIGRPALDHQSLRTGVHFLDELSEFPRCVFNGIGARFCGGGLFH